MKSVAELEQIANIAAEQYLKNNVPLNESIVKLAQEHALNHEHINRVVETANTNVYVKLFNESNNKYIEFPNADSEKIATLLNPPRDKSMNISDYKQEPAKEILENIPIFPETKEPQINKEAESLNHFYKIASLQERINNAIVEVETEFEKEFDSFTSMIKQAVLSGTSFEEVQTAITSLLPDPFLKVAMKAVQKDLVEMSVIKNETNFEKTSSINTNHPIIKKAEELLSFKNALLTLNEKLEQNQKEYELFKTATVGSFFGTLLKNPGVMGSTFVAGGLAGILGYKKYKKIREMQENSPLLAVPDNYKRNL